MSCLLRERSEWGGTKLKGTIWAISSGVSGVPVARFLARFGVLLGVPFWAQKEASTMPEKSPETGKKS